MALSESIFEFRARLQLFGLVEGAPLERQFRADLSLEQIAENMLRDGLLTVYQRDQLLSTNSPHLFIAGKYRILELLGRGGMGDVYLCDHVRMKRLVAIKVLPEEKEEDEAMLARFEREAQAIAALDHPNIVRAFDIDEADGKHYLVMEFVDGADLHSIVSRLGPLSPERAAWCIAQTALGLHHAWLNGWIHRDIKPGNLLLDRNGSIKILDMGLARIFSSTRTNVTSLLHDGYILGTADYLSPEQAAGIGDVDIRSDIYSLGATLYFLLTGRAPFEDGGLSQKLLWHRTIFPRPVTDIRSDIPEGLAAILLRMLAKTPEGRQATPGDVADALMPYCTPTPAMPDPRELLSWSPAVMDRINASQATNEEVGPPTAPIKIKPAPQTLVARIRTAEEAAETPPHRTITLPYWMAVCVALLFVALTGWTVLRETTSLVQGSSQRPRAGLELIGPMNAGAHVDEFACIEMPVAAVETGNEIRLLSNSNKDTKAFYLVADSASLSGEWANKRVRVVGRVLRDDAGAAYIRIFDPKQIQIIDR